MFLTFHKWRDLRREELEGSDPLLTCPQCHGEEFYEEECESCGHEEEKECQLCDGGKLRYSDFPSDDKDALYRWEYYVERLLEDAKALAGWLAKDPAEVLVKAGFVPYTELVWKTAWCGGKRELYRLEDGGLRLKYSEQK